MEDDEDGTDDAEITLDEVLYKSHSEIAQRAP